VGSLQELFDIFPPGALVCGNLSPPPFRSVLKRASRYSWSFGLHGSFPRLLGFFRPKALFFVTPLGDFLLTLPPLPALSFQFRPTVKAAAPLRPTTFHCSSCFVCLCFFDPGDAFLNHPSILVIEHWGLLSFQNLSLFRFKRSLLIFPLRTARIRGSFRSLIVILFSLLWASREALSSSEMSGIYGSDTPSITRSTIPIE